MSPLPPLRQARLTVLGARRWQRRKTKAFRFYPKIERAESSGVLEAIKK